MKTKISLLTSIILILICSGICFFVGYKCNKNNRANFNPMEMKNNMSEREMPTDNRNGSKGPNFNNQITGSISSISDGNFTVQMENGSSNIVYLSNDTYIGQMTQVSKESLATGTQVLILGSSSTDGTFIAESVQIK
jgi:hypothetical protein